MRGSARVGQVMRGVTQSVPAFAKVTPRQRQSLKRQEQGEQPAKPSVMSDHVVMLRLFPITQGRRASRARTLRNRGAVVVMFRSLIIYVRR
jgi:hypothetical protein